MTNDAKQIDNELREEIKRQVQAANQATVDLLREIAANAIRDEQERLIANLGTQIKEAVRDNQRVVVATIQEGAGGKETKNREFRIWPAITLIVPILLTAMLGLYVERRVEGLQSKLELTGEFYKKRLEIYDKNHKQIVVLVDALHNAQVDAPSVRKANESLHLLNQGYTADSLYMSNDLLQCFKDLYKAGSDIPAVRPTGKGNIAILMTKVSAVEEQMKKDLRLDEVGQINVIFGDAK